MEGYRTPILGAMVLTRMRQVLLFHDGLAVNGYDQVPAKHDGRVAYVSAFAATMQSGTLCCASRHNLDDQQTGIRSQAHFLRKIRADRNTADAKLRPANPAQMDQIVEHSLCRINGDGEADACALFRAAGEDHGVDADHLSARVQQRPAGISGIDGCVRLDGFVNVAALSADGTNGADDAARHGAAETERVPDGIHFLAHNQALGITDLRLRHGLVGNLNYRQIMHRIGADHLRFVFLLVAGGYLELARSFNHMEVGKDV